MNLFEEYAYFDYKFPEPQYLGAKYVHRQWIGKFVPEDAKVVLDAFGGSQSMAFLFKQMGKQTITVNSTSKCKITKYFCKSTLLV